MNKGKKIYVEGRIQTRTWDDPKSGQKRYFTEIVAENIIMLDSKGGGQQNTGGYNQNQSQPAASAEIAAPAGDNVNIPAPEEIPTINIDEDQEEIQVKDIPF